MSVKDAGIKYLGIIEMKDKLRILIGSEIVKGQMKEYDKLWPAVDRILVLLKEAGCVILDREKLEELPECPYKRTEYTSAGMDIYIQAYYSAKQADLKHFEDSIEEL